MKDKIAIVGQNHHYNNVTLFSGTEEDLFQIARTGNSDVWEVTEEDAKEADEEGKKVWPDGAGWYYRIGDSEHVKVDTRWEGIFSILTNDAHPLCFSAEEALDIVNRVDRGDKSGLWHHNEYKVLTALRNELEYHGLYEPRAKEEEE